MFLEISPNAIGFMPHTTGEVPHKKIMCMIHFSGQIYLNHIANYKHVFM
jgi:hypothetical protein